MYAYFRRKLSLFMFASELGYELRHAKVHVRFCQSRFEYFYRITYGTKVAISNLIKINNLTSY